MGHPRKLQENHKQFIDKKSMTFRLLSDEKSYDKFWHRITITDHYDPPFKSHDRDFG